MSKHVYGWRGPSSEARTFQAADTSGLAVKPEVDPRKTMPPIFDQGQLGSCTANAICAALEHDANLDKKKPGRLARLLCYYEERKREGSLGQGDAGAYGYDGFLAAAETGLCAETDWPYDISTFEGPPPAKALKDVTHYRLTKPVHTVAQTEHAIKQVLSNGQTIAFGFIVYESFEDESWWKSGVMPVPAAGEKTLGGHEMLWVGYLKAYPGYLIARNSWNEIYGLGGKPGGYLLFPLEEALKRSVTSDLRTIVRSTS